MSTGAGPGRPRRDESVSGASVSPLKTAHAAALFALPVVFGVLAGRDPGLFPLLAWVPISFLWVGLLLRWKGF